MDYDDYLANEYILTIAPITSSEKFRESVGLVAGVGFAGSFTSIVAIYFGEGWLETNVALVMGYYTDYFKTPGDAFVNDTLLPALSSMGLDSLSSMVTSVWNGIASGVEIGFDYVTGQLG